MMSATLFLYMNEQQENAANHEKAACGVIFWHPRRESNSQLTLRRGLLYPFNYGGIKKTVYSHKGTVYFIPPPSPCQLLRPKNLFRQFSEPVFFDFRIQRLIHCHCQQRSGPSNEQIDFSNGYSNGNLFALPAFVSGK